MKISFILLLGVIQPSVAEDGLTSEEKGEEAEAEYQAALVVTNKVTSPETVLKKQTVCANGVANQTWSRGTRLLGGQHRQLSFTSKGKQKKFLRLVAEIGWECAFNKQHVHCDRSGEDLEEEDRLLDSGCSNHLTGNEGLLSDF